MHTDQLLIINLMSQLCSEQKLLNKMMYPSAAKHHVSDQMCDLYLMQCCSKMCLFCFNKNCDDCALSTRARLSCHLKKMHYSQLTQRKLFECLHSSYHTTLQHIHHFQTYAVRVHEIEFIKNCDQVVQLK